MSFKAKENVKEPDYFSDDEVEEQNYNDIMDDYPDDDEEYEMDEETRRIIFAHSSRNIEKLTSELNDLAYVERKLKEDKLNIKKEKKQNKLEKKGKTIFSISDFNKKLEEEENAKKPKKFVSKRADERKKQLGIEENVGPRRSFNPRKQPYNFVKSRDKKELVPDINSNEFPSL
jgi:hypothetical protein